MRRYLLLFSLISIATAVLGQDLIESTVNVIVDNNAELKSRQSAIMADRLDMSDENSLANPSVGFARVWGNHGIGNKLQLDISQEFAWPGVYGARRQAADMAMSAAQTEYDAARLDVAQQARQLLIELVFVRKQICVINELKNNFGKLGDAIDKGVRGGELTVLDQRKMQIESYEIDNELSTVHLRAMQIEAALQAMSTVAVNLDDIDAYPIQQLLDRQAYIDMVKFEPQVAAQSLAADAEALNAKAASRSRLPGFSVGYQHQAEMGDRFNGFTVGVKLPFFEGRKARQAALERQNAAELQKDEVIARRVAEINGTYSQLELYRSRLEAYNRTFGDNQYLELLLKAYKGGQISVIEYLSEIHYYHQTMLLYLESEYNYNLALTELNRNK